MEGGWADFDSEYRTARANAFADEKRESLEASDKPPPAFSVTKPDRCMFVYAQETKNRRKMNSQEKSFNSDDNE